MNSVETTDISNNTDVDNNADKFSEECSLVVGEEFRVRLKDESWWNIDVGLAGWVTMMDKLGIWDSVEDSFAASKESVENEDISYNIDVDNSAEKSSEWDSWVVSEGFRVGIKDKSESTKDVEYLVDVKVSISDKSRNWETVEDSFAVCKNSVDANDISNIIDVDNKGEKSNEGDSFVVCERYKDRVDVRISVGVMLVSITVRSCEKDSMAVSEGCMVIADSNSIIDEE